jgi:hypothetical protein
MPRTYAKAVRTLESLEQRTLMAWSSYAQLVNQDDAASAYSSVTGAGVTVAVIDTGVDYTHPSLGGGFGAGKKVIAGYDFVDNDADPLDEDGHGTSVAGVIAASAYTVGGVTYQGVAPDAKIVALRAGTESGLSDTNIEKSLQWVITNATKYDIQVVNLSLGSGAYTDATTANSRYADEFSTLRDMGIFVVAASGNSNDQSSGPISQDGVAYPAADPNVFAVGAVDSGDVITTWAQRGTELDLLAPGVDIVMPKLGGGTVTEDGTSFSSPYVAGTAALIKQLDPTARAGDVGSILMASGTNNRDGSGETGNTTTLQFSRLDIKAALDLTTQRVGKYNSLNFGKAFDTAVDSQGVLHVAYYDADKKRLLYVTRDVDGKYSAAQVVDASGDVGRQVSIAVDETGKVGVAYYDAVNTAVKYAAFDGKAWSTTVVESKKNVGTFPSLAFDIDGNANIAYYQKSGGNLRLATLDRDTGAWTRRQVDGEAGDVGQWASIDIGEAERTVSGFTVYDTTVAVAYADVTNGDVKYARIDIDDPTAVWFITTVADGQGVANVSMKLHDGPSNAGLQAQVAWQDTFNADVNYAFKISDTAWTVETVAGTGKQGDTVQLYFDENDDPSVAYYNRNQRAIYTATRSTGGSWSAQRAGAASGPLQVAFNQRTGDAFISFLNRTRDDVFSQDLIA